LSEQELYVLENYQFANDYLQKAADLFVFSCYTGFSYADMIGFNTKLHTREENNGTIWIYKSRQKNGEVARLPLFPKAFNILEKYNNVLPVLSNQSYNANLKEIALLLSINKKLTTHVARKTAGFVWLNTGLDYETVAAMLGHANIRITQSTYAKVLTNRIEKKLQEVNLALFIGKNEYDKLLTA
jgi:integrase/recombinase XerD